MFENLDQLIEINLALLLKDRRNTMFCMHFEDLDGRGFNQGERLAKEMLNLDLVEMNYSGQTQCTLTEFGYNIANRDGWLKHLENQRKDEGIQEQIQEVTDRKNKIIQDVERKKLFNEAKLAKWQTKAFWWIFGFAVLGGASGFVSLIWQLLDNK